MAIVVKRSGGDFVPCPAGTWPAVCVDVIDLGDVRNDWKGDMVHKVRLVWQISERMPDDRPYLVSRMYTASLHEKSSLRKDLSSWRGQDFKPEELAGFDLENVLGVGCLLSVMQQPGNDGQMYSNVIAVMRLPNGYEAPRPEGYVRQIHRQDGMVSAPRHAQGFQQQPFGARPATVAPRGIQPQFQQPYNQPPYQAPPQPAQPAPSGWTRVPHAQTQQPVQPPYPEQAVTDEDIPF